MHTAEDILKEKNSQIVAISYDKTVLQASEVMTENRIGAILVTKNNDFVGIWTERDLLHSISVPGFNPETTLVGDHMTSPIHIVSHNARLHRISDMFLGLFVRHLLVEKDGEHIGLISIGDLLRAMLLEQHRRFKEVNEYIHWDYFENWKRGRPKRT